MSIYFAHLSILFVILIASAIYERPIKYNKLWAVEDGSASYYLGPVAPWVLAFGYLAFLAGMRSAMNDTTTYVYLFNTTEASWDAVIHSLSNDIRYSGTEILTSLFKMFFSKNYHVWFLTWAIIESILIVNVLRRETVSFMDACFFFFASTLYYNYFTMMRQWMAVAITFWGFRYLRSGSMMKYFLVCIIAAAFHPSALIMLPLYFMVTGKAWQGKQMMVIAGFVLGLLFLSPLLSVMGDIAEGTTYDYVFSTMSQGTGSSILRGVIAAVPVWLAFVQRNDIDDPTINICVNMSLINMMLSIFAAFTSGMYIIRVSTYMSMYNIILYPYLLNVTSKNKQFLKIGFYIFYFAFFVYQANYMGMWEYNSDVLTWMTNAY